MSPRSTSVPLCVDLDGTLIYSDLLYESLAAVLGRKPWMLLLVPFWLLAGRAALKQRLAEAVDLDPAALPYNQALLEWLHQERRSGRTLVLATAADQRLAHIVAAHLGIFDEVIASDGVHNLKAGAKAERLEKFIGGPFDYVGNGHADLPVWRKCRKAILSNAPAALVQRTRGEAVVERVFPAEGGGAMAMLRCLRPRQWLKNLLVFVPLAASHHLFDPVQLWENVEAFAAFCLCASAIYVLNDLVDLPADRLHPVKRRRPFASGSLSLGAGLVLAPVCVFLSLAIALQLKPLFLAVLAGYFALATAYSLSLKRRTLVDVFALASLYSFRLLAGHVSADVIYSPWLLSFSFFIFLSLAYTKRAAELYRLRRQGGGLAPGREYRDSDLELVTLFGTSSGFAASLVLTLYLNSERVQELYQRPILLWLMFPLVLYWVTRIWVLVYRGQMSEDPIEFALKDRVTYVLAAVGAAIAILATHPPAWLP
jgi:4-hydroxybenzoate polyprenyltransferase/phosphoserine phosphatase